NFARTRIGSSVIVSAVFGIRARPCKREQGPRQDGGLPYSVTVAVIEPPLRSQNGSPASAATGISCDRIRTTAPLDERRPPASRRGAGSQGRAPFCGSCDYRGRDRAELRRGAAGERSRIWEAAIRSQWV